MQQKYIYYKVLPGTDTHKKVLDYWNALQTALGQRQAVIEKYGAYRAYASSGRIHGLFFKTPPASNAFIRLEPNDFFQPNTKAEAGKALAKEFKIPLPITQLNATLGLSYPDLDGFHEHLGCGLHHISFLGADKLGDTLVLLVPILKSRNSNYWTPPATDCVRLKNSEYWLLKEAFEEGQANASPNRNSARRSGRTTRMLERAKKLNAEGRAVYVIADNKAEVNRLKILLGKDIGGIKVETQESLSLNFDWCTLRGPGMRPNCAVLVDHHAIEDRFAAVLKELHAYDK